MNEIDKHDKILKVEEEMKSLYKDEIIFLEEAGFKYEPSQTFNTLYYKYKDPVISTDNPLKGMGGKIVNIGSSTVTFPEQPDVIKSQKSDTIIFYKSKWLSGLVNGQYTGFKKFESDILMNGKNASTDFLKAYFRKKRIDELLK